MYKKLQFEKESRRGLDLFYEKYSSMIYGIVLKGAGNEEKRSEVFQHIFSDEWKKIRGNDFDVNHCIRSFLKLPRQRIAKDLVQEKI